MRRVALSLLCVSLPLSAVRAQQRETRDTVVVRAQLPRDVAVEVVSLFNATTTMRTTERTDIAADARCRATSRYSTAPSPWPATLPAECWRSTRTSSWLRGARIDGDLLVVGGEVEGSEGAVIGGELRIYHAPLRYTQQGDQLVATLDATSIEEQWWRRFERRGRRNFNRLEVASAGVYNRVEGLPVRVGPVLYRDQGWDTASRDGGRAHGEQLLVVDPGSGTTRFEARAGRQFAHRRGIYDIVDGVEDWQLSNAEVALASFFFHRDYRDYYGRHGGQMYARPRDGECGPDAVVR
jgi:hypothetical protein